MEWWRNCRFYTLYLDTFCNEAFVNIQIDVFEFEGCICIQVIRLRVLEDPFIMQITFNPEHALQE